MIINYWNQIEAKPVKIVKAKKYCELQKDTKKQGVEVREWRYQSMWKICIWQN